MEPLTEEYNGILLKSKTAGEALRGLFYTAKAHSPTWSLGVLAKKTGIRSKGFLSEIMAQKKRLQPLHVDKFAKAFDLSSDQKKVFKLLAEKSNRSQDIEDKELGEKLQSAQRSLKIKNLTVSGAFTNLLLTLEIYSLVNMYPEGISYNAIQKRFKDVSIDLLLPTIGKLIEANLIRQDKGIYLSTGESFLFSDSQDGHTHLDFLKDSISKSLTEVERWFGLSDRSHLESSLITVNSSKFVKKLPVIKEKLLDLQKELEDEDPDMILRFNVQITP